MRTRFTLFLGIFVTMALSNAIVPVLPAFAERSTLQGAIYSVYFFGALLSTLPGGILSDRFGRIMLMRVGLLVTVASGLLLLLVSNPILAIAARFVEGLGAGIFVAAALSLVNSRPDHERMSGYYMASLNAGLVLSLVCSGWLAGMTGLTAAGLLAFTAIACLPAAASFTIRDMNELAAFRFKPALLRSFLYDYRWLWLSTIILIGISGILISLYPEFSDLPPQVVGVWIAIMSLATILAVLGMSRVSLHPVRTLRWSAVLMGAGAILAFFSPAGFVVVGLAAGAVMMAQMAFLAKITSHQGVIMGLYSAACYLGMALLPFVAGIVAETRGFFMAFCMAAILALLVALTISRCDSCQTQMTPR